MYFSCLEYCDDSFAKLESIMRRISIAFHLRFMPLCELLLLYSDPDESQDLGGCFRKKLSVEACFHHWIKT